ncbi:unnamed protein product, partial [Allacma fusca]
MNFVNEPISSIFAATLGLGESSSAGILEKCLKTFFPRIITSTDKLQEVTQLICKLSSLQNILQCGLLDVREESCNSARRVSLKRNIERQESRQESDHFGDEQFCSFNLMCKYEWMDRTELDALVFPPRQHWREITIEEPSRDVDYILEVDLLYPDDLHRDTASLP